mmetsp:Transcript_34297/g.85425  ORF Transcript_34297/g.85425 Transcript_34297/m.85425 type:complete len:585 (-) Transcript_34297:103-1857(-)
MLVGAYVQRVQLMEAAGTSVGASRAIGEPVQGEALLLRRAAGRAATLSPIFQPWEATKLLCAYASIGDTHRTLDVLALFRTIARVHMSKLETYSDRDLAMLVWAFSYTRTAHSKLITHACVVAHPRLATFSMDSLGMMLWAVSSASFISPLTLPERVAFVEKAAEVASRHVAKMDWRTALHIIRACARVPAVKTTKFTLAIAEHAHPRLAELTDSHFSFFLWSFTELNVQHPPLVAALKLELARRALMLDPITLAQVASASAVLGLADAQLRAMLIRALNQIPVARISKLAPHTLTQVHLFAWAHEYANGGEAHASEVEGAGEWTEGGGEVEGLKPPAIRIELRLAAQRSMVEHPKPESSFYHTLFSQALVALGVPHQNEHIVDDMRLGYTVDIALPASKVAIEVNGPMHYDDAQVLLPRTVMKHRMLRRAGWHVVCIPYFDWISIETREERQLYVRGILGELRARGVPAPTQRAANPAAGRLPGTPVVGHLQDRPSLGAGSKELGPGSRRPGAGSRGPGSDSRGAGSGSREPGSGSRGAPNPVVRPGAFAKGPNGRWGPRTDTAGTAAPNPADHAMRRGFRAG